MRKVLPILGAILAFVGGIAIADTSTLGNLLIPVGQTFTTSSLNQVAAGNIGNTCAMAAGTTCTITLAAAYTSAPLCLVTVRGASIAAGTVACNVVGTTVTVTAQTSNSLTFAVLLVGNPN